MGGLTEELVHVGQVRKRHLYGVLSSERQKTLITQIRGIDKYERQITDSVGYAAAMLCKSQAACLFLVTQSRGGQTVLGDEMPVLQSHHAGSRVARRAIGAPKPFAKTKARQAARQTGEHGQPPKREIDIRILDKGIRLCHGDHAKPKTINAAGATNHKRRSNEEEVEHKIEKRKEIRKEEEKRQRGTHRPFQNQQTADERRGIQFSNRKLVRRTGG